MSDERNPRQRDLLHGFTRTPFEATLSDRSVMVHDVYRAERTGPPVIVIHEAFGLSRYTVGVARRIQKGGMTPVLPVLAGRPLQGLGGGLRTMATVCVRREFGCWARNEATPIVEWLRALAADEHAKSGGSRVGVVGMCFSGGYALAMALEPSVGAAVSSQPAFPAAIPGRRRNLGVNPEDMDQLRVLTGDGECVRALRFQRDPLSPGVRLDQLVTELPAAQHVQIPSLNPLDHSVLSKAVEAPVPSKLAEALDDTIEFLRTRLTAASPAQ
jgi:dienelactone hydrolase